MLPPLELHAEDLAYFGEEHHPCAWGSLILPSGQECACGRVLPSWADWYSHATMAGCKQLESVWMLPIGTAVIAERLIVVGEFPGSIRELAEVVSAVAVESRPAGP